MHIACTFFCMEDALGINVYSEEWSHKFLSLNQLTELTELTERNRYHETCTPLLRTSSPLAPSVVPGSLILTTVPQMGKPTPSGGDFGSGLTIEFTEKNGLLEDLHLETKRESKGKTDEITHLNYSPSSVTVVETSPHDTL